MTTLEPRLAVLAREEGDVVPAWGREMLDKIFATSGLNLRVESMSRTRAMAGFGTGKKGSGFEGSTYMRHVGGSTSVNCLV
jgi:hypothetical protein